MYRVVIIAAMLAIACSEYELPPVPLALHTEGARDADAILFQFAAKEWNDSAGMALVHDAEPGEECGAYVVAGDRLVGKNRTGLCQWVSPCRVEVMIRPGLSTGDAYTSARHELGHALMTCSDADHSDEDASAMNAQQQLHEEITRADIAAAMGRMQ